MYYVLLARYLHYNIMLDKLNVKNRRIHQITVGHTLLIRCQMMMVINVSGEPGKYTRLVVETLHLDLSFPDECVGQ